MVDKQWITNEIRPLKRLLSATSFAVVFIKYNLCPGHIEAFLQCILSLNPSDASGKHVRGRRSPRSFPAVEEQCDMADP